MRNGNGGKKKAGLFSILFCCAAVFCFLAFVSSSIEPVQDAEGYYLLDTPESFRWFTEEVREGNKEIDVRLTADLVLNDTTEWESWEEEPPENVYRTAGRYNGHFDGNGHTIEGYYASDSWSVFTILEEDARVSGLTLRNSLFDKDFEEVSIFREEGLNFISASSLCHTNYGRVENCRVEAVVRSAWSAGGIVALNYGQIENCRFTGRVEAGSVPLPGRGEEDSPELLKRNLAAGGICRENKGTVRHCLNEGEIAAGCVTEEDRVNYVAGGIAGIVGETGSVRSSINRGAVTSAQLAGGIAGTSWGEVQGCINGAEVKVEQVELGRTDSLVSAGICASNGGRVASCLNTGKVGIRQRWLSLISPVYGVACNSVNPEKGTTENCFYLADSARQDFRQSGVSKVPGEEWDGPPGTDEKDFIHLQSGPEQTEWYRARFGDSLWSIAREYYGDGALYPNLIRENSASGDNMLYVGEQIEIPPLDEYLPKAVDETGLGWASCVLPDGTYIPTRFAAARPEDWYEGTMEFQGDSGMKVLWPKTDGQGEETKPGLRVFFSVDGSDEDDFLEERWEEAKEEIAQSARLWCADQVENLRFYRYRLENGEHLYGYTFRLNRDGEKLACAVYWRLRKGMCAEFIGLAPAREEGKLHRQVRYLAARVDQEIAMETPMYPCEGMEGWPFPRFHNPFALAMAYNEAAECSPYMLWTGGQ